MDYAASTTTRSRLERLFGLPLFYKVLIANSVIVLAGAIAGTTLTLQAAGRTGLLFNLVFTLALAGTFASVVVNWFVLRAALRPLSVLEQTVDEVRRGNFSVRAEKVGLSDPNIDNLTDTFNRMLDAVEHYRQQIRETSVQVLSAQEAERKRISRELHDDTAQALTAQLLRLKTIEATGGALDPAGLAQLIELTAETLEKVRNMAHELRPPSLDDLGLQASLESLAAQSGERFGLPVMVRADRSKARLTPDVELAVYRIVQEALTNVAKHAQATEAVVTLRFEGDTLRVNVRDNGRGCDLATFDGRGDRPLGIFGMRERAMLVNGTFSISSKPNKGTLVTVTVPLTDSVTEILKP